MTRVDDYLIPDDDECILLDDSGCDQSIINISAFKIFTHTGVFYSLGGAMKDFASSRPLEVVNDAYTLAHLSDGRKFIFKINQALCDLDKSQNEALLAPHQARQHGTAVDNCAKCNLDRFGIPGGQCIATPEGTFEFNFDGRKCYFVVSYPTEEHLRKYPHIELTSSRIYEPIVRKNTVRRRSRESPDVAKWRENLGYPTFTTTEDTLANTSQMVTTLQSETREYMRDSLQARAYPLRPHRINDTLFSDTFYSGIVSIRGYKCFQMFAYKKSQMDVVQLMKREKEAIEKYEDTIIEYGAPTKTVTDNAQVMTGKGWRTVNRKYCIQTGKTVPYQQQQNYAESRGGNFKFAVCKLMHMTPHSPVEYWCFAASFLDKVRRVLSKPKLNGASAMQQVYGCTVDISRFRFPWFSPVWYFDPTGSADFPNDRMKAGFFLDIADNTGDAFSYVILPATTVNDIPLDRDRSIVRNIVRPRSLDCGVAPLAERVGDRIMFFNANGDELFGDAELETNDENIDDDLLEVLDLTEQDIRHAQRHDNLPDTVDIRDRTTLTVLDSPLDTIPEEPADEQNDSPLSSEEPASIPDVDMHYSEEPGAMPSVQPSVQTPVTHIEVPIPPMGTAVPNTRKRNSSAITFAANDEAIPPSKRSQTVDRSPLLVAPQVTQDSDDDDDLDSLADDEPPTIIPAVSSKGHAELNMMAERVCQHFNDDESTRDIEAITDHRIAGGVLELQIKYSTGDDYYDDYEWHPIGLVKDEDPYAVAKYVINNNFGDVHSSKQHRWARALLRSVRQTIRRRRRVDDLFGGFSSRTFVCSPDEPSRPKDMPQREWKRIRRAEKVAAKKKRKADFKYGIEIPHNWSDIVRIDQAAGNTLWAEAVKKEVAALIHHGCFHFVESGAFKPKKDEYQYCHLHFVYEVKTDLRQKARLVANGSTIDAKGLSTRATVVKGISVRLLDLIADAQDLKVLCGDIGNAFIQADTKEKIYTRVGKEFGEYNGMIAIIVKALYGLTTSAERFHTLFSDFLRTMGFKPTRFDRDVWMRLRDDESGYDYICTHVDDFKVVVKDPMIWIERIAGAFLIKEHGPRNYYLGNDYTYHETFDMWTYGSKTYAKEAVSKIERIFGCLPKETTPLPSAECHPEMDDTPLLDLDGHRKYQMVLGMLQWLMSIGRPDLSQVVASLNRFGAAPREGHLKLALRAFGYIKQTPNKVIAIDSRPLPIDRTAPDFDKLIPDFLQDYPDAKEEIASHFPKMFGPIMDTTILVDADHAHDKATRKSITGLLAFVGSTPVLWLSKRQGSIASSTYAAEFSALRTATEEAISLRYILRCLGCNVPADGSCPTKVFGDNLAVIQSSQNPAADISKKHVAISFHTVREAIAARIIAPYWLKGKFNLSDIMTKQIPKPEFMRHCDHIFWRPNFHIRDFHNLNEDYN